jgi:hypothetical protein
MVNGLVIEKVFEVHSYPTLPFACPANSVGFRDRAGVAGLAEDPAANFSSAHELAKNVFYGGESFWPLATKKGSLAAWNCPAACKAQFSTWGGSCGLEVFLGRDFERRAMITWFTRVFKDCRQISYMYLVSDGGNRGKRKESRYSGRGTSRLVFTAYSHESVMMSQLFPPVNSYMYNPPLVECSSYDSSVEISMTGNSSSPSSMVCDALWGKKPA